MVMRTLRNKVSLIVWLSGILLVAMLIGLVAPNFLSNNKNLAGAAAVVDGQPIDPQDYSNALTAREDQARKAMGEDLSDADSNKVRRDTLNDLIDEQLAVDHAQSVGQTMSPEEFRQELMSDPSMQDSQGHFDQQRYQQILEMQSEQGYTWQQAEAKFQRALLLNKVRGFWACQAVLTPAEVAEAEARYNRQLKATAVVWNLEQLRSKVVLSDDDLHTYYSENKRQWVKPDQVKLRQILVRSGFATSTATAAAQAGKILAKLKAGADFKALASKENSDDSARKSGGDLGWVTRDDLRHEAVADAAFGLKKGAFSGVIETPDGFTIVKVEDRKKGFEPTFANSKALAAKALSGQRADALASTLAHQALAAIKAGKSIADAAKAAHGTVVSTAWFGRDDTGALPALGPNPDFAKEVCSLDKGDSLADPVTTPKAVAIAVLVDERPGKAPAKPAAALARSNEARQDALEAKAKALYQAWLVALRKKAEIVDQSGALASN
ncbi:MAG TPA: SurA N-terminal domain-containing protein [bacterium]|jgi:peptidyl-prolyl cis-trans isomerase D|nr:SurA N-terminal domain-containing protein [bacterium]